MIGKLNHIAIATPKLDEAVKTYKNMLGVKISSPIDQIDHGVKVVFIELQNTKIELLEPLGEKSPIENFLEKNKKGGIHHICFEVKDINSAILRLKKDGATVLGDGEAKIGAHGNPVIFLHPKDFNGTLIELEEVKQ
ncbi:methylmalonyl-CoA epimerase [Paracoccaceae bacterium]|nr:methylmalonyl-CoA epimerase [Paracoccaceae bacterium]MDC3108204.1 methylmalonyl-CoA epimerase [Paracoccaceae bacterium]|tara:strand:- start:1137 stop:1547 length:411 start_codon:yes stop_codon:yes gene_type:complete